VIEPDLQLTIKGLHEEGAQKLGQVLIKIVQEIAGTGLDLRGLRRIIVTTEYAAELKSLVTTRPGEFHYTNEEGAVGAAQSIPIPLADGGFDFAVVCEAYAVIALVAPEATAEHRLMAGHILHHELCHIHHDNTLLRTLPDSALKRNWRGEQRYIHLRALSCWSEYFANRISAYIFEDGEDFAAQQSGQTLVEAIPQAHSKVQEAARGFRLSGQVDPVVAAVDRYGGFLLKSLGSFLGYADGLEKSVCELSPTTADAISATYFAPFADRAHSALSGLFAKYQEGWTSLDVLEGLAAVVEDLYDYLGIHFTDLPDGQTWVDIASL